jgi:hypothetical protein
VGWNADFGRMLEGHLEFQSSDLSSPSEVDAARSDLSQVLSRRRYDSFSRSPSAFLIELLPNLTISPSFTSHLAVLPQESVRIILIFFANLFQFTYFRSANLVCAFCQNELPSTHLFVCQGATPSPLCNWVAFVTDFRNEDFHTAFDRLFLILQRWTILTNRFQPSLAAHIDEYFTRTDFQNRRRDPQWFLQPTRSV